MSTGDESQAGAGPKGRDKVTIKIPRALYNNLKLVIEGSGFDSVTDFVVYVLRDIASTGRGPRPEGLSKDEIEAVRQRLKALGYL
jgi:hypothetical protein